MKLDDNEIMKLLLEMRADIGYIKGKIENNPPSNNLTATGILSAIVAGITAYFMR
jgi:hypothetical protein